MRHGNRIKKLGRTSAHRKATMAALSNALIAHKRIRTTYEKAKALRGFVEPLINRAKSDTVHNRRQVFRYLQDKESVKTLFGEVAEKIADRPGGYTRVIKLGRRQGDGAEVALIELVDYNDVKPDGSGGSGARKKTRRSTRRKKSDAVKPIAEAAATVAEVAEELADEMEDTADEVVNEAEEIADAAVETTAEVVDEAAEVIQEAAEVAEEAPESAAVGTVEEVEAVVEEPETKSEVAEGPAADDGDSSDETAVEEEDDEKK